MARKSDESLAALTARLMAEEAEIALGGGTEAIERQHKKGRLAARERIARLIDPASEFFELGIWAGWQMYDEWGGAPAGGVICGIGTIAGRRHMIIANDATVKAGAFFPVTAKKVLRAQRIAFHNRLPLVYLVDSAGIFLPLQEDVFPDEDDFGRIFRNNAVISAAGIGQIAAIMGNCVAGGGYLPVLCDKILMTEGSGLYLAGPALVRSAIGQKVSHEELGGAEMHAAISGTIDYRDANDEACLARLRRLAAAVRPDPADPPPPFFRRDIAAAKRPGEDLYDLVHPDPRKDYEIRDVLDCLADEGSFDEYKADFGQTLVCGTARIGGFPVGVVANQHHQVRPESTVGRSGTPSHEHVSHKGEIQYGGVIYVDSADKAARFVMSCNQEWLPLVFLQDVNGFMVGRDSEQAGIIKAGAKLVNAISNSRVPKLTVILGGSYGAGNYALCGKAFDPRLIFAWPTARYAVMGGQQATSTLLDITVKSLERQGHAIDAAELAALRDKVQGDYDRQTDVRYSAARGWVDKIIDPAKTREVLIFALETVTRCAEEEPFRVGVYQV
jgi:3-methylcrotonyl-CoA carboxylase beta subunit